MFEDESNKKPPCEVMPEQEIDETLAESFPASDPPPWTLGIEYPCEAPKNERIPEDRKQEGQQGGLASSFQSQNR